jgi:hypothetical protein
MVYGCNLLTLLDIAVGVWIALRCISISQRKMGKYYTWADGFFRVAGLCPFELFWTTSGAFSCSEDINKATHIANNAIRKCTIVSSQIWIISEVQGHLRLQLRLDVMTESQSSYNIFHLNELMKLFKLANHLHSIKNNLKFQIGSVR